MPLLLDSALIKLVSIAKEFALTGFASANAESKSVRKDVDSDGSATDTELEIPESLLGFGLVDDIDWVLLLKKHSI